MKLNQKLENVGHLQAGFHRELPYLFEMNRAHEKSIEIFATYFLKQHLRCISIMLHSIREKLLVDVK